MSKRPIITAVCDDKRGRILSVGQNSYTKTHPLMSRAAKAVGQPSRIYLHAEVAALLKCDWSKVDSIFVSRYNGEGKPMTAKPCLCCQHVLKLAGVTKVRHT